MKQVLAWTLLITIIMLLIELHPQTDRTAYLRVAPTGGGMNPVVEVASLRKNFEGRNGAPARRVEGSRSEGRRRRIPLRPRTVRLRQVDLAQRAGRPRQGLRRKGRCQRRPCRLPGFRSRACRPWLYRGEESRLRARQLPRAGLALGGTENPLSRDDGPVGLSRLLSPPDIRRHGPAPRARAMRWR